MSLWQKALRLGRRGLALDDPRDALLERVHLAVVRDPPLGKDADEVAVGERRVDATLVVSATNLTGGTDVLYEATESVTIASGVTVNTRKVASGADPTSTEVVSTGDSGDITIKAPTITVQSGAVLDASVRYQLSASTSLG